MPIDPSLDLLPAFENFDAWEASLPEPQRQAVQKRFQFVPPEDRDAERQRFLAVGLVAQRTGHDALTVSRNFENQFMPGYAKDARGLAMPSPPKDVGEFFNAAKSKLVTERDDRYIIEEGFNEGVLHALDGEDYFDSLSKWTDFTGPKYKRDAPNPAGFTEGFNSYHRVLGPMKKDLESFAYALNADMKGEGMEPHLKAIEGFSERILAMPSEDQQIAKMALANMLKKKGKAADKGVGSGAVKSATGFAQEVGEGLSRFLSQIGSSDADRVVEMTPESGRIQTTIPAIDSPDSAKEFLRERRAKVGIASVEEMQKYNFGGEWRELAPEETALIKEAKAKQIQRNQLAREIRQMAESSDPVGNISGGMGTSLAMVGGAFLSKGRSLPLAWQLYAGANYNQLRLEHPDMPTSRARQISQTAAAGEAAIDLFQVKILTSLPTVKAVLKGGLRGVMLNAVPRIAGTIALEQGQEGIQDLTLPVVQHLFAALAKDVPGVDWNDEMTRWADSRADVLVASLPLILLGAGVATHRDIQNTRAILSDNEMLARAGVVETDRLVVLEKAQAGDLAGSQAALQTAWGRRDPAVAAEYQGEMSEREIQTQQFTEELVRRGMLPDIRVDGDGYTVRSGETVAKFKTWEEARSVATQHMNEQERNNIELVAGLADSFLASKPDGLPKGESFDISQRPETLGERVAEKTMTPEDAMEAAVAAGILKGMDVAEARGMAKAIFGGETLDERNAEIRRVVENIAILGSNRVEGGESKSAINFQDNPQAFLTAIEEPIEGRWKAGVASKKFTKAQGVSWVRLAEAATGEKFLEGMTHDEVEASAEDSPRALTEAISRIAVADVLGRMQNGKRIGPGSISRSLDLSDREQSALASLLAMLREFIKTVLDAASKLTKAREEGKLGAEYDALFDALTGSNGQHLHERGAIAEAQSLIDTSGYSEANPGPNGETFSLAPMPSALRLLDTSKIEASLAGDEIRNPASIFKLLTGMDAGGVSKGAGADANQRRKSGRKLANGEELARRLPVLDPEPFRAIQVEAGGGEHSVFADSQSPRVIKLTKPGFFGYHAEDAGEYVQRWALANRLFGDNAAIEGFVTLPGEDAPRLVISQPFVFGKDSTVEESSDFLQSKGFHEHQGNWVHPILGVTVRDTLTTGNAITRENGSVMPIDWILEPTESADLRDVREKSGQGRETSFSLRSGDYASRAAAMFSPFQRTPELRMAIARVAKERVMKAAADRLANFGPGKQYATKGLKALMEEPGWIESRAEELTEQWLDGLTQNARMAYETGLTSIEDHPLIKEMRGQGLRIMRRATALKQGLNIVDGKETGDYNGMPALPTSIMAKPGFGAMPDKVAQALHDSGMLPDAHSDTLWDALSSVIRDVEARNAAFKEINAKFRQAKKEAMAQAKSEAPSSAAYNTEQRKKMKELIRVLDAALSAVDPTVRAKVGGYARIPDLDTDEKMMNFIEGRIKKMDVELSKWLKKEAVEQIEKLLKKGRPDSDPGKKAKGKDADMHRLFAAAEAAAEMNALQVAGRLADLDTQIASGDLTAEQEVLAMTERGLVELVGDLKNADSGRAWSALDTLKEIYQGGWLKWKLAQIDLRENRDGLRHELITDTGKRGIKPERDAADQAAATLLGKIKGGWLSLSSFHEVLSYAFGAKSARVTSLVDAEREAAGQYEDANQALADEVEALFSGMAGSALKGERLRYDMAQRSIKTAKGELSQLEAIQALLMWRQEDGQRHMDGTRNEAGDVTSSWHYDQAWIDEITAALTPEARQVMAWIMTKYGAEWQTLNPLYRSRYGVNLPHHDSYAPLTVTPMQTKAGEVIDPVSGSAISSGSILTPGSLRTRSRSAIAEPEFRDALQTLVIHSRQMEYWKAYYDLAVEANAALGNREVLNAVKAKGGEETATALRKWVDAIAQGGFRDASATLGMSKLLSRMTGRAASVGLLGRFSTLLVQSTQLAAASVKMPVGAYLTGMAKLLTGRLGYGGAIRSDFIQRRYKSAPPIVRQALDGLGAASKPNQITRATRALGQLLSGTDALFTSGTYALLLDYHRSTGRALGFSGAELEAYAHTEAERDTEQVAQPTRMATRSLAELTSTNPIAKVTWAYASEARQKIALMAWATYKAKAEPAQFAKTAFLVFGIGGLLTQVIKGLWREAKGDDDERKWSPERLTLAALAGPLHGVPLASELMGDGGMLSGVGWAWPAAKDLASGDADMRDIDTLLSVLGLFNDTAAGISSLSHAGLDAAKVIQNLVEE